LTQEWGLDARNRNGPKTETTKSKKRYRKKKTRGRRKKVQQIGHHLSVRGGGGGKTITHTRKVAGKAATTHVETKVPGGYCSRAECDLRKKKKNPARRGATP